MQVAVCVATYQRPEGLKNLLDGLNKLTFSKSEPPEIEAIVVDNDSTGSARAFCESIKANFKWSLKYCVEPQRGISYVRNRAIASVSKDAEFIAFIDDDEVPDPSWLEELLSVQHQYDADVVSGPVIPYFKEEPPDWVIKGKFFDPGYKPTGHPLKVAFTNNALVRAAILTKMDKVFDERFALTGGEDAYLFMGVYHAGYKLVWANDALVREWIPKSRTNIKWILQRGYRSWSTHSLCERELEPSVKVQFMRLVKGSGLIFLGLFLIPPSLFAGQHALIRALLHIARGAGTFSGLAGKHYEEYKNIHGV